MNLRAWHTQRPCSLAGCVWTKYRMIKLGCGHYTPRIHSRISRQEKRVCVYIFIKLYLLKYFFRKIQYLFTQIYMHKGLSLCTYDRLTSLGFPCVLNTARHRSMELPVSTVCVHERKLNNYVMHVKDRSHQSVLGSNKSWLASPL